MNILYETQPKTHTNKLIAHHYQKNQTPKHKKKFHQNTKTTKQKLKYIYCYIIKQFQSNIKLNIVTFQQIQTFYHIKL